MTKNAPTTPEKRRETKTGRLAQIIDTDRKDAKERLEALRLQTHAWRQLCMIALVDQEWARGRAQWLFFSSVPYVDGEALRGFIEETKKRAQECGLQAGVFS